MNSFNISLGKVKIVTVVDIRTPNARQAALNQTVLKKIQY